MSDENFGIVVQIDPRQAVGSSGAGAVDAALARNEQSAREFKTVADEAMRAVAAAARESAREQERAVKASIKEQSAAAAAAARERKRLQDEEARRVAAYQRKAADEYKQAQAALGQAYRQVVGPAADYLAKLNQIVQLERQGSITAQQRARAVASMQREIQQFNAKQQGGVRGAIAEVAGSQFGQLATVGGAVAAGVTAAKDVAALSDAYAGLTNRIRTVTSSEAEALRVREQLLQVANRTRSDINATSEGYVRMAAATKNLGLTQSEVIQFTESLAKTIKLSGATSAEAQAGLIQLAQGLGAGALRGDELRSVLEQLGPVADVIAKKMGVTRGQLRLLGEQGKITADVVVAAFRDQRDEIDQRFGKSVATFSDLWTVLHNSIEAAVGQIVEAAGGMPALTKAVQDVGAAIGKTAGGVRMLVSDLKEAGVAVGGLADLLGGSDVTDVLFGNVFSNYADLRNGQGDNLFSAIAKARDDLEQMKRLADDIIHPKSATQAQIASRGLGLGPAIKEGVAEDRRRKQEAREAERATGEAWRNFLGNLSDGMEGVRLEAGVTADTIADIGRRLSDAASEGVKRYEDAQKATAAVSGFFARLKDTAGSAAGAVRDAAQVTGESMAEAARAANDNASAIEEAFASRLGGAIGDFTDALVEMSNTGRASFGELVRSMLVDLEKLLVKMLVFQGLKAAFSFGTGAGSFGSILGGALGIPGFAAGGSFTVPSSGGGTDSVPVMFRATPGERVTITPPGSGPSNANARPVVVDNHVTVVHDYTAAIREHLASSHGQRQVVEAIAANPGAVRTAVAR